jgi:hypothetical protein
VLLGNIDCVELLPNGTPAQVDAAVRSAIADAAAGGGLIVIHRTIPSRSESGKLHRHV